MNNTPHFDNLLTDFVKNSPLAKWAPDLQVKIKKALASHGNMPTWLEHIEALPSITPTHISLNGKSISAQTTEAIDQATMTSQLMNFQPWRKGPYHLHGIDIDTEWRSDLKWERLKAALGSLEHQWVLDVGCGSGYHMWRMLGAKAKGVVGIEPMLLYFIQFQVIKHFMGTFPINVLPLTLEALPQNTQAFDTTFSMGVLYHRRSPIDHLLQLRDTLKTGGRLVLETLIVDGPDGYSLVPTDRYANMRNVWFIPTIDTLNHWLLRCKYKDIDVIDINQTSVNEQRSTPWMSNESLIDTLDKDNTDLTIEGYPRPKRVTIFAKRC